MKTQILINYSPIVGCDALVYDITGNGDTVFASIDDVKNASNVTDLTEYRDGFIADIDGVTICFKHEMFRSQWGRDLFLMVF